MHKNEKISLVVLAAGMGSRYGGLKQMDSFGPNGETIIDYSLYDAHRAGFNQVVFIIREYFADKFKEVFDPKLKGLMAVDYVYQELPNLPVPYPYPAERDKPWGTGHAVWVANSVVKGPFAVINADDYYGPEAYVTLYEFLTTERAQEEYSVVGYKLANTLSAHGTVNRGVCKKDSDGYLVSIEECKQIGRNADGVISYPAEDGSNNVLTPDTPVSMNMWGFYPSYFHFFEEDFDVFFKTSGQELKSEYYIPSLIDSLIRSGDRRTQVLECDAEWFGVTYREDKEFVSERLANLLDEGVYPYHLWKEDK
ncbi:MAG: nucleotidyltransferase [Saprospiraceae bacterium]|nr:nucleotidyltransferase [Saprospiraceae bacterium]